jgi:hypothetical protein
MRQHPIAGIEQRGEQETRPCNPITAPADAARGGFSLHAVQLVPPLDRTRFAWPSSKRLAARYARVPPFLAGVASEVRAQPGLAELISVGLEGIIGQGVLSAGPGK